MEYSYRCPNCGYKALSHHKRLSPECPKCNNLLDYDMNEDDRTELQSIVNALGESIVVTISKQRDTIFVDFGRSIAAYDNVRDKLLGMGYYAYFRERDGNYYLMVVKKVDETKEGIFSKGYMYVVLLVATILSTIYAGYALSGPMVDEGIMESAWGGAISFSLGLMTILGCHEMGHKIQSIRSGISSSWPYFIPMPFLPLGTLGALIKMKGPIPTKNDAVYLGAAGPLIGVLVAIPVVIIGMRMSFIVPASTFDGGGLMLGNSVLFTLLTYVSSVSVPEGMTLWVHPLAFAGWVGLFITMLNLLPAGQLDGGHVVRALFGERGHRRISMALVRLLVISGIVGSLTEMGYMPGLKDYFWSGWLLWGLLIFLLTKGGHPGALNETVPLSRNAKIVAAVSLVTFILCFVPVPLILQ